MKFTVTSYSFAQYMRRGLLDQLSLIKKVHEFGFDAIEFTDLTPPSGVSEEDYAKMIREECDKYSLPVSSYTISADFMKKDGEDEVERVMKKLDIASILGAPFMRHDATWSSPKHPEGFRGIIETLASSIRKVTEYGASLGIKTMVENHGYFIQDADRVEALINAVAHPNFGWLCDMGNFMCADEKSEISCGKAAPYTFYVHAKDFIFKRGDGENPGEGFFKTRAGNYLRGTILGHGVVPVRQCLGVLKKSGFDGYVSLEFEGMEDCLEGVRIGLANLKRFSAELA